MKKDGKNICRQLKDIRRRVADENDIPLEQHECGYEGECNGTCPRCEAEVKYLEEELHRRTILGKVAALAGVAMSMVFASCTTQGETDMEGDVVNDDTTQVDTTSGATQNDKESTIQL